MALQADKSVRWVADQLGQASTETANAVNHGKSDNAIEVALTLRLVLNLPLRQAEGFLRSVLSLLDVISRLLGS